TSRAGHADANRARTHARQSRAASNRACYRRRGSERAERGAPRREAAMKILVVDDDPDLLSVIEFALQQAGSLVVKAADGESALRAFEREHPDLALLDVNLPKLTGFALAQELRERGSIPIMMLTVRSEENDVVRALSLGADDYLTKPFSPKILIARIRAL